ncbi:MAG TPA: deoxynucleoside kinase [Candidatus Saccharimonadales bacterium]|nr:deoxynucleoside kinase [Candidatus Saccharimonadales bacterium]
MGQPFFLAIAGNIGVGKTYLTRLIHRRLGWIAYLEPAIENPFLAKFYADMKTWALRSQMYFLEHRADFQRRMMRSEDHFIQDRTIYEDAEVFERGLYHMGLLTEAEHLEYRAEYQRILAEFRPPDMVIYLRAHPETLLRRIAQRGRECERSITAEYLGRLEQSYERWAEEISSTVRVHCIDTNKLKDLAGSEEVEEVLDLLCRETGSVKTRSGTEG